MRLRHHFLVLLVMAIAMTALLYGYKPRHYELGRMILSVPVNVCIWLVLFGIPYCIVAVVIVQLKRL